MGALKIFEEFREIDISSLKPLQRILLVTDGTLTEILEAHFLEPIRLIKLSQEIVPAAAPHARLEPGPKEKFLERKILLRGSRSGTTHVYAESAIAFERLGPRLRDGLLNSDVPLGRLWLEHKLETFKEMVEAWSRPANDLNGYFGCEASLPLLGRTYRVIAGARPVMMISEYFPAV